MTVDRQEAGNGNLEVEILDPQDQALKIEKIKTFNGEDSFTFLPSKLGAYKLLASVGGFAVPSNFILFIKKIIFNLDTPKIFYVEEPSRPIVYGFAIDYAVENGQYASLIFDSKNQKGGLKVEVRGPISEEDSLDIELKKVKHTTNRKPDGTIEINFKPLQVGRYAVGLEFNNKALSGWLKPIKYLI